uniref:Secreted protein n=1 Tax=Steinernema glaseri TaxID=37863 RepID=A0A1I8ALJ9_9BILA
MKIDRAFVMALVMVFLVSAVEGGRFSGVAHRAFGRGKGKAGSLSRSGSRVSDQPKNICVNGALNRHSLLIVKQLSYNFDNWPPYIRPVSPPPPFGRSPFQWPKPSADRPLPTTNLLTTHKQELKVGLLLLKRCPHAEDSLLNDSVSSPARPTLS